jgi:hypothetical protein
MQKIPTFVPVSSALDLILARIAKQNGFDLDKIKAEVAKEQERRR